VSTANMLVEFLAIGVCACLWLLPILESAFPTALPTIGELGLEGLVLLAPAVYVLGAITNFLADRLLEPVDKRLRGSYGGKEAVRTAKARILAHGGAAADYLLQRRSIVRIYRATVVNLGLFLLVMSMDVGGVASRWSLPSWEAVVVLAVALAAATWAHVKTLDAYFAYVTRASDTIAAGLLDPKR